MSLHGGNEQWEIGPLIAYQGKPGCTDSQCTRVIYRHEDGSWEAGECVGWHCSRCHAPCASMGHPCSSDN
jgi:hypothetical protein